MAEMTKEQLQVDLKKLNSEHTKLKNMYDLTFKNHEDITKDRKEINENMLTVKEEYLKLQNKNKEVISTYNELLNEHTFLNDRYNELLEEHNKLTAVNNQQASKIVQLAAQVKNSEKSNVLNIKRPFKKIIKSCDMDYNAIIEARKK